MRGSLKDAYKTLSDYDRHYSSVRSALATFLFSLSYGSMAVLFKDVPKDAGKDTALLAIAMLLPFIFLLAAFLLSCYFQRLTYASYYMEHREAPDYQSPPHPLKMGSITAHDLHKSEKSDASISLSKGLKSARTKKAALWTFANSDRPPRFFGLMHRYISHLHFLPLCRVSACFVWP